MAFPALSPHISSICCLSKEKLDHKILQQLGLAPWTIQKMRRSSYMITYQVPSS